MFLINCCKGERMKLINKFYNLKYLKMIKDGLKRAKYDSFPYPKEFNKDFKKCIIFTPHPDDETIGLGGFMLKYNSKIKGVYIFTNKDNEIRVEEAKNVSKKLNIPFNFVGNGIRINEKEAIEFIRNIVFSINPDVICIPSFYETHVDHFHLYHLTMKVLEEIKYDGYILMYEVWNTLTPNYIVDISNEMEKKEELIKFYKTQVAEFNYVRFIKGLNIYRGMQINKKFGEGVIFLDFYNLIGK